MDPKECSYCHRVFSSVYNRKRHERLKHPNEGSKRARQETNDSLSNSGSGVSEENEPKTRIEDSDAWDDIVKEACDEMETDANTTQDLLKEPHASVFLETLHKQLTERLKFAKHMDSENELYGKIQQTAKKYIASEEQYDKDEAFKKAWQERKIAIMDMLSDHEQTIDNALTNAKSASNSPQQGFPEQQDDSLYAGLSCVSQDYSLKRELTRVSHDDTIYAKLRAQKDNSLYERILRGRQH